jgi:hypothetical protein
MEKSDTSLLNVPIEKEMEVKLTFQKHKGEMLRQNMQKVKGH